MATKPARPGRTLIVFFVGAGDRLRAGRPRRHLEARARPGPPGRHPDHADAPRATVHARASSRRPRKIIDQRVNGSGVAEAEVTTQGNTHHRGRDPRRAAARPRRRPSSARPSCGSAWWPAPTRPALRRPGGDAATPSDGRAGAGVRPAEPDARRHRGARRRPSDAIADRQRQPRAGALRDETPRRRPTAHRRARPTPRPTPEPSGAARPTRSPRAATAVDDPLTWIDSPNQECGRRLQRRSPARRRHAGQRRGRPRRSRWSPATTTRA